MTSAELTLPLGFESWPPAWQAVTLGLMTLGQEDLPTVAAALLASVGALSWQTGFWGCFLGIWVGDILLYLAAHGAGGSLENSSWFQRFANPEAVARCKAWFARRGLWVLVAARFIPGTRLGAYLTAGFLRLPFLPFALITGVTVAIWTAGLFLAASTLAPPALKWLLARGPIAGLLGAIFTGILLLRLFLFILNPKQVTRARARWQRWVRWEFWPATLFYLPVAFYYLWLSLRYGGPSTPACANPGMFTGGLVGESKIATLDDLWQAAPENTARALRIEPGPGATRQQFLEDAIARLAWPFPWIIKPDVGQRGAGVKLVRSFDEARSALAKISAPLIGQEYAPGPCEIGLFYYRFPHEATGRIFAITEKIFPELTGDGVSTLETLIWRDDRARCLASRYLERFAERKDQVLAAGERLKLVEAGNHAQGCVFQDGMHLATPALLARIDQISRALPGFFIGRYDLRYRTAADLAAGHFQIVELNGAGAEATSIYDAKKSLRGAYRTLFQQWRLVFAIGAANRQLGAPAPPALELWRIWRRYRQLAASYPAAD